MLAREESGEHKLGIELHVDDDEDSRMGNEVLSSPIVKESLTKCE